MNLHRNHCPALLLLGGAVAASDRAFYVVARSTVIQSDSGSRLRALCLTHRAAHIADVLATATKKTWAHADFRQRRIDAETICDDFELTYNLELDKRLLSFTEAAVFEMLLMKWFGTLLSRKNVAKYRTTRVKQTLRLP